MIRYSKTRDSHDCCGCYACEKICAVNAITLKEDERGFFYPVLDETVCVNCGRCETVCPMEKNYAEETAEPDIYAAVYKNPKVVRRSSSGGVFSVLCKWIIDHGGSVYGAAFDDTFTVKHERGVTVKDIRRFMGSKYVESCLEDVYEQAAEDLRKGKYVLLSGTPCQISALRSWMELKRVPTEKMYSVDVICHGVPSRKVWKDYLNIIQTRYAGSDHRVKAVNMRSKHASWEKQEFRILAEGKRIDREVRDFSFNKIFLSLNLHRSSCFNCRYTSYKRPGDFSLGDFWNYKQAKLGFSPKAGLSEVFVNTEKGRILFQEISANLNFQPISKELCWQPHLEFSAKEPKTRETFWRDYLLASDKEAVLKKYMKGGFVTKVIHVVTPVLRKTGLYTAAGKFYRNVFKR